MVAASPASYYLFQEPEAAAPGVMGPAATDEATGGFLQPHAMRTAQWTQWTSEGTLRTSAPKAKGGLQPQESLHLAQEAGVGGAAGTGWAPTFVRVVQLEDVRVLGVIRQLHHPAHDGDLFARRGFVLGSKAQPRAHTLPPLGGLRRPRQGSFPPNHPLTHPLPAALKR